MKYSRIGKTFRFKDKEFNRRHAGTLKGVQGVLLLLVVILLVFPILTYGYSLCNPSGSGCYNVMVYEFGPFWPSIFAPGAVLLVAFLYSLKRDLGKKRKQETGARKV